MPTREALPAPDREIAGLTQRLARSDEAAFREFHALYFDRLYHFLLGVTRGQPHAAQDALQETLLRVVRHARPFESEDVFWSWLKAIARNAARDVGRGRRRYFAVLEKLKFWQRSGPSTGSEDRLHDLLDESLSRLDAADRRLIERKYLHGLSVAELALELGQTEKAIESRLGRLRRKLGEHILQGLHSP